ncbi:MAG: flavin reductase family protein [Acidobacteria bacterium]|nr:flavin reductase family protein [Acidobacteriota bacterium]
MEQVKINKNLMPPMPVVLVGTIVEGKINFMPVGWCMRANANPPMIAIGINNDHHTIKGITENKEFSICFPDSGMHKVTDYLGIVSGADVDKTNVFETFKGTLGYAPMIASCPVNLECKLLKTIELPTNTVFIGEIVEAYAKEDVLDKGKPVVEIMKPMILTMFDSNRYWSLGEVIGYAWKDGLEMK